MLAGTQILGFSSGKILRKSGKSMKISPSTQV
jgi:hypothetical protein